MPRVARLNKIISDGVYHTMSRIAISEQFSDSEKETLVKIIHHFTKVYFAQVYGYCIMGNHFHLIVQMNDDSNCSKKDFVKRYNRYKKGIEFVPRYNIHKEEDVVKLRQKWSNISDLMKDIKLTFTRYYNAKHQRKGFLWGGRFKSVLLQKGNALINCMAYVDLNPVRAGIVKAPEEYRWSSLYYHLVKKNGSNWLSLEYANPYKESNFNIAKNYKEKRIFYRKYMYQVGSEDHFRLRDGNVVVDKKIPDELYDKAEEKDFQYSFKEEFMHQCRYFSDSLIIGTHEFVEFIHSQYKNKLFEKRKRRFYKMKGFENIYSMRDLRNKNDAA